MASGEMPPFDEHDLVHHGEHIRLRTFAPNGDHAKPLSWYILRPGRPKSGAGPFYDDELDMAKDIAADYMSYGPAAIICERCKGPCLWAALPTCCLCNHDDTPCEVCAKRAKEIDTWARKMGAGKPQPPFRPR